MIFAGLRCPVPCGRGSDSFQICAAAVGSAGAMGERVNGRWLEWRDIPVMVSYHPSYLLRPYNQDAKREAWEDLKKVLHFVYD